MNESSFNRSINIETENIDQAHQKAVSLMDKIEQLAITFFSSINEHSAQAGANKDRTIELKEVIVPLLNYEQYEEIENFRKICDAFEKYSGNENPDAFIIFENQSTQNILQFCKTKKSEFQLNVPMQCLNSTERIRAERYLRKITETKNGENLFDETNGFPFENDGQFYMVFPEKVELVTKIIIGFFIEVYLLPPNFKLKITEESF